MPANTELHETLNKLHGELEQAQPVDDKSRELLQHLQKDIQGALDRAGEGHPEPFQSLRERLEAAVDQVENEHPRLTLAIGAVLDNLAAVGL